MNRTSSNIKDIVNKISDEFGLDNDWLNDDFKKTTSYTPKLVEHSKFYKRFYNCLDVRTVSDEYVVAMKLCSGRDYKYDLSDVVGIIMEHSESQKELKRESIEKAYHELYNQELPEKAKTLLDSIYKCDDLADLYYSTMKTEQENKKILIDAEKEYGNALNKNNAADFIKSIKAKNENNHTDRGLTVESDLTEIGVHVPKDEQQYTLR